MNEAGVIDPGKLKKVDRRLWLALVRMKTADPTKLRNATNRELALKGRLEFSEAALAREAPASRNTISDNRERLADLLEALAVAEKARFAKLNAEREDVREDRRTAAQKDRIIDEQASVIAAQVIQIFGLERRIASLAKRSTKSDSPSPPLGRRSAFRPSGKRDVETGTDPR